MTAVKGSKQLKMMVVPYRPWIRVIVLCVALAVLLTATWISYFSGLKDGQSQQAVAISERNRLQKELEIKQLQAKELSQEVANLKLGSTVDRKSSEDVRAEVIELKSQIAAQKEDISFYRGLMSPTDNKRGLTIGSLNVISTGTPRHYEYKLVVQQLATRHAMLNGYLTFEIFGRQLDQLTTLPLKDISSTVSFNKIKLRFKYFQTIEGRLILPEGFEPERIELVAKSLEDSPVEVKKKFGWLVQEG
jgi:hypothetical protein